MLRGMQRGNVNATWFAFVGSIVLFGVLVGLLVLNSKPQGPSVSKGSLVLYCAAGIKTPVEAIVKDYEAAYGVQVQMQYGGSQTLLANIEIARTGDLFLPADDSYIAAARQKKLVSEKIPLAKMLPQLAVKKGNPLGIKGLNDLATGKFKLAQANPDAAAIGKLTRDVLSKSGEWETINKATTVFKGTVNDVANDIKIGAVDAGFVWDSIVKQYPDLEAVDVPQLKGASSLVSIAVLNSTKNATAALHFARYLGARDKGLKHFEKNGYMPVDGDDWSERPDIRMMAGSMLQPAIKDIIKDFEKREGASVTCIYNGCGILVAQIRAGEKPDAYFACDTAFMKQVNDLFLDSTEISQNQLVIVVQKGNPHEIKTLKDLAKSGLRVGIGHEQQCAMGVITMNTLHEAGVYNPVMKNVVVQTPTGDMLINQLRTGSLDAAIAYKSNVASSRDKLDSVPIDVPCAIASQPVAVGKESKNKQITSRLVDTIKKSQAKFESEGFTWKLGNKEN